MVTCAIHAQFRGQILVCAGTVTVCGKVVHVVCGRSSTLEEVVDLAGEAVLRAQSIFVSVLISLDRHAGGRIKGFRHSEVRLDPSVALRVESYVQPTCGFAVIALFPKTTGSRGGSLPLVFS